MDLSKQDKLDFPTYQSPSLLRNGHLATIVPKFFRPVPPVTYRRERIETPDGDFIDLDYSQGNDNRKWTALLLHGLEGDSSSKYILGLAQLLNERGYDAVAMNHRGCSGEDNRLFRSYHSGATEDVETALKHLYAQGREHLILVGFSLGGNLTLKYMGEQGEAALPQVAVAWSVPCDLGAGAYHLAKGFNKLYLHNFLRTLKKKAIQKKQRFPDQAAFTYEQIRLAGNFKEYDDLYTGPAHGFRDAEDYWTKASSIRYLHGIRRPTLILNAENDPFLPPEAYPVREVEGNPMLRLEVPAGGGHVGFAERITLRGPFYFERRTVDFIGKILGE